MNTKKQIKENKITMKEEYTTIENNILENYRGIRGYHTQNNEYRDIHNGYGIELETYTNDINVYSKLARYLNYKLKMNVEEDGSITGGYGMELISQPYTKEEYLNNKDTIQEFFDLLNSVNQGVNNSTGLHVHISKKLIGKNDIIRENNINKLFLILENYKDTFTKFARRDKNYMRFCNYLSNYNYSNKPYRDLFTIKNKKHYGHDVAINRDNKTYEIRIFKATLDYKTFIATLQMVFNLVEIINKEDISDITFNDIVNLHTEYTELIEYCKENKISNNNKLIDKTKTMELLQLKENSKILKENYNYNRYIEKVRNIILNNSELYSKSKEEYNTTNELYSNLNYIFTQTYKNSNSIYYQVKEINNLLSYYTTKNIVNLKTNEIIQKRVFNQEHKTKYNEYLTRLEKLIQKEGGAL